MQPSEEKKGRRRGRGEMEFMLCVSGRGNSDLRLSPGITSGFGQVLLALMPGAKAAQVGGGDATAASACGHAPTPGKGAKRHCSGAGTGTGSFLVTLLGHFFFSSPEWLGKWEEGQLSYSGQGLSSSKHRYCIWCDRPLWLRSQIICGKKSQRGNVSPSPRLSSA